MTSYDFEAERESELKACIRSLLPTLPDEVADGWMLDMARDDPWPPAGAKWNARLAGHTIQQWQNFSWTHEQVDLVKVPFSDEAMRIIKGLSEVHFQGLVNAYSTVMNSRDRMQAIYQHIKATRLLPKSLILIDHGFWELVDGCHRVTMYAAWLRNDLLKYGIERKQSAWVARFGDGREISVA
jgi:hypothetical protein